MALRMGETQASGVPWGEGLGSILLTKICRFLFMQAHHQAAGLDKRLRHAETALAALTPPRGRGKRQITEAATLVEAIDLVLKAHRVEGLLSVVWEKQVEQHTQYLAGAEALRAVQSGSLSIPATTSPALPVRKTTLPGSANGAAGRLL